MRMSPPGGSVDDMASAAPQQYRWTRDGFLRAYEAGAFDERVELVNGEVWPVVIGDWHGEMVLHASGVLSRFDGVKATSASLPTGDSVPDPDFWIRRAAARPVGQLSRRLSQWDAADVLLVVEISDETLMADLSTKAGLYGSEGYPTYWVISPDVIYVHTEPITGGYKVRTEYRRGDRIPVPYADTEVPVDNILVDDIRADDILADDILADDILADDDR